MLSAVSIGVNLVLSIVLARTMGFRGLALAQGLEALPYYLDTHPGMVAFAHRAIAATLGQQ